MTPFVLGHVERDAGCEHSKVQSRAHANFNAPADTGQPAVRFEQGPGLMLQ